VCIAWFDSARAAGGLTPGGVTGYTETYLGGVGFALAVSGSR